jgi:hypothetical protein
MKDFHDLYSMISSQPFLGNVEEIIRMVFEHRETELALPVTYDADELNRLQIFWNEYLRNLRAKNLAPLPENIADVIAKINHCLELNTGLFSYDKLPLAS